MTGRGEPERLLLLGECEFLSVLGVDPLVGRTFQAGDDKP